MHFLDGARTAISISRNVDYETRDRLPAKKVTDPSVIRRAIVSRTARKLSVGASYSGETATPGRVFRGICLYTSQI